MYLFFVNLRQSETVTVLLVIFPGIFSYSPRAKKKKNHILLFTL